MINTRGKEILNKLWLKHFYPSGGMRDIGEFRIDVGLHSKKLKPLFKTNSLPKVIVDFLKEKEGLNILAVAKAGSAAYGVNKEFKKKVEENSPDVDFVVFYDTEERKRLSADTPGSMKFIYHLGKELTKKDYDFLFLPNRLLYNVKDMEDVMWRLYEDYDVKIFTKDRERMLHNILKKNYSLLWAKDDTSLKRFYGLVESIRAEAIVRAMELKKPLTVKQVMEAVIRDISDVVGRTPPTWKVEEWLSAKKLPLLEYKKLLDRLAVLGIIKRDGKNYQLIRKLDEEGIWAIKNKLSNREEKRAPITFNY